MNADGLWLFVIFIYAGIAGVFALAMIKALAWLLRS